MILDAHLRELQYFKKFFVHDWDKYEKIHILAKKWSGHTVFYVSGSPKIQSTKTKYIWALVFRVNYP